MIHRRQAKLLRGKRIAFLSASIHSGSSLKLWHPLADEAERAGVELFLFPGGRLSAADPEEALKNRLFEYAAENVDGIVTWASALGGYVGAEELNAFHDRFRAIPLVAMAHRVPGRPTVRIDAYSGMFPLLDHLYEVHGVRRFAFISGPAEHESARDRLRAFRDFHSRRGLRFDSDLVSSPRPWNEGGDAATELLDGRRRIPGRDYEALLAASDMQLYDAVRVLQARGYRIPQDLRTAGFNDSVESRIVSPAFTTVHLPFDEQAELAFRDLLSLLTGEEVPGERTLECRLVIRRSCGCLSSSVIAAGGAAGEELPDEASMEGDEAERLRKRLVEAAAECLDPGMEERIAWLEPLADAYLGALDGEDVPFLQILERIMERQISLDRDISGWQDVLSAIKREAGRCLAGARAAASDRVLDRARVVVAEAFSRMHRLKLWEAEQRGQIIRDLEKDLIHLQDRRELSRILASRLTRLGIGAVYVTELRSDGRADCIAGYREDGRPLAEESYPCPEGALVPREFLGHHPGTTWVVEPLCGNGQFFGWVLLRLGVRDGALYEELRSALSSALLGLRSIDLIRKARSDAERAEKLKAGFLAGVSAEFIEPLREIEQAAGACGGAKGELIRVLARRQQLLTREIVELSRAEVGELALDLCLVDPGAVLGRAGELLAEEADLEPSAEIPPPPGPLPLILGDGERLSRSIATLFKGAEKAEGRYETQGGALIMTFTLGYRRSRGNRLALESSRTLARRILVAHGGLLEEIPAGGDVTGWMLRLPLPALGPAAPVAVQGPTAAIGSGVDPAAPLADPESYAGAGAFLCDFSSLGARDLSLILNYSRDPVLSRIPWVVLNAPATGGERSGLKEFFRSFVAETAPKGLLVFDADAERRRSLLSSLSAVSPSELRVIGRYEEYPEALHSMGAGVVVVLRGPDPQFLDLRREIHGAAERPVAVMLCGPLMKTAELERMLKEPRVILLNDGVLTPREFAALVSQLLEGREVLPPHTGAIVKNAVLYLNQNLSRPVLRWKMAENANVSEDYLTRVFSKELGISPWEYLIRLRILEAKRLIAETSESIGAIAEAVGFTDQAYFCRVFKKMTGCPPREYRRAGHPLGSSE